MTNKFKEIRKQLGLTQKELEKKIGTSQCMISYYERTSVHKSLIFYINLILYAKHNGIEVDLSTFLSDQVNIQTLKDA